MHLKVSDPVYSSNSYQTLSKAARAGRGIGLLPVRLVAADLADGSLVDVVPGCEVPDRPLYALHSPGGQTLARVRLFLDFVTDWFRRQSAAQTPTRPGRAGPACEVSLSRRPGTIRLPAGVALGRLPASEQAC